MQHLSFTEESGESAPSDEEMSSTKTEEDTPIEQPTLPAPQPAVGMKMDDDENPF